MDAWNIGFGKVELGTTLVGSILCVLMQQVERLLADRKLKKIPIIVAHEISEKRRSEYMSELAKQCLKEYAVATIRQQYFYVIVDHVAIE